MRLPDGRRDRLQHMHKMENVPHSFQIICTLPSFFPCLTPLSPRLFSRSLVLTFARITYHCEMLSRKRRRNPPLTCLISPAGQLILLTPSFPSPLSFEKNLQKNKAKKKNWMWRELWVKLSWCTNLITRGGSDVTAPSGCAVLWLYWTALSGRIALSLFILLEIETIWHCLVIVTLTITLLKQLTTFSFGKKIVQTCMPSWTLFCCCTKYLCEGSAWNGLSTVKPVLFSGEDK